MKSYSSIHIFTYRDQELLQVAKNAVASLPPRCDDMRCHELARVIGRYLDLPVQDGHYGLVEHSWLWTKPIQPVYRGHANIPHVLDVYCVGSLPQVRLIDVSSSSLPHMGWGYRPGETRKDIDEKLVDEIYEILRSYDLDLVKKGERHG